ncbi:FadR/GntR family transcriptional regulator [Streptomyces sp. NPDC018693]|uniref:FadR/GntR family transcriptional regulator n=1 Tax=unclassified Streptomyces TaxID=2593676 RepID=UPI0037A5AC7F
MALTHPRRSALSEQVVAELRKQITSGEWPVGSRIPTEPELVEQLGVARNTVREAVRAPTHNGLLDIRQGSGTFVVATSELTGVMHRRFADADPRHIAELCAALESSAAGLAAVRRTEKDLRQLDALLRRRDWLREDVGRELTPETHMDHTRLLDAIRAGDAETAAAEAASYPFLCRPERFTPSGG